MNMKKQRNKSFGQGMTEYIIIVALIAIAAIAVYALFGDTLRTQAGNIATTLSGGTADHQAAKDKGQQALDKGKESAGLDNFDQKGGK